MENAHGPTPASRLGNVCVPLNRWVTRMDASPMVMVKASLGQKVKKPLVGFWSGSLYCCCSRTNSWDSGNSRERNGLTGAAMYCALRSCQVHPMRSEEHTSEL